MTEKDRVVVAPLTVLPTKVRAEVEVTVEPDQSTATPVVPPAEPSRTQLSSDFPAFSNAGMPTRDREKVLATSTDDGSSVGYTIHLDIRVSKDELVLANPALAKRLIEATLLPTDREKRKN